MTGFYNLIGPALRCLDPETAHGLALAVPLRLAEPTAHWCAECETVG